MRASMVLTDRDPRAYIPSCEHADGELRLRIQSNGVKTYKFQCQVCGGLGSSISRSHFVIVSLRHDPPLVDDEIASRHWESIQSERAKSRDDRTDDWWTWYQEYLETDQWKQKSKKVLMRDGRRCRAELDGCQGVATQAHHLTYKHVGNEPLFDLIAICGSCHDQLHEQERERRAA